MEVSHGSAAGAGGTSAAHGLAPQHPPALASPAAPSQLCRGAATLGSNRALTPWPRIPRRLLVTWGRAPARTCSRAGRHGRMAERLRSPGMARNPGAVTMPTRWGRYPDSRVGTTHTDTLPSGADSQGLCFMDEHDTHSCPMCRAQPKKQSSEDTHRIVLHGFWNTDQAKTQKRGQGLTALTTQHSSCCREQRSLGLRLPSHGPKRTENPRPLLPSRGRASFGMDNADAPGDIKVRCC